mmetsp:Transcript_28874/g.55304  ORF Transcript_28874/g.55304 Transcript_28874/m.55304 type:complete len:216 (-) Transcript_28874:33-680(-)
MLILNHKVLHECFDHAPAFSSVGLNHRQSQRRLPAHRLLSGCDIFRCFPEPRHDLAGVAEHGVQAVESFSRGVAGGEVAHGLVQSAPLLQPVLDLLARPDERHPVHRRHHRLLHQLAVHVRQHRPRKRLRLGVAPARAVRIGLHPRPHDLGDPRVHVRRLGPGHEVDRDASLLVPRKRRVVLQAVAGAVLVHWEVGGVLLVARRAQGLAQLEARA